MANETRKPILCLDFDGVCHSYVSGWKGAAIIPDAPVEGMWEFLQAAIDPFEVHIFSSRTKQAGGKDAMFRWFLQWASTDSQQGVAASLIFPDEKPPAFVGLDDRVLTFRGEWPAIEELLAFKTWTQSPLGATNRHPRGKFDASDEGELKLAVFVKEGTVVMDFGKPVAWMGLDARSAREMAALLTKHADTLGE